MKKIKSNKGITIVSLVVTIIVILILTTITITSTYTGSDYKRYKLMCADVEMLEDNIIFFYGFSNDFLIAAKIREIENYNLYENIYNTLSNELNFSLITDNDYIKLKKHL